MAKKPEKWGDRVVFPKPQKPLPDPTPWESVESFLEYVRYLQIVPAGGGVLTVMETRPVEDLWDAMRHLGGEGMPVDPTGRLKPSAI